MAVKGTGTKGYGGRKQPPREKKHYIKSAITIALGLVALLVFWPRMTVQLAQSMNPQDVLGGSFTITNNTLLIPFRDVSVFLGLCGIELVQDGPFDPDNFDCPVEKAGRLTVEPWKHHLLNSDQSWTLTFNEVVHSYPNKVGGFDLGCVITYHWWFLPMQFTKAFRFVTRKQPDGTMQWFALPVD
jgi:hypothetical protein